MRTQPAALSREILLKLGQMMRCYYDASHNEPLPPRLAELLRRLDEPAKPPPATGN